MYSLQRFYVFAISGASGILILKVDVFFGFINNIATLKGTIDSLQEKILCETVAKVVKSITAVKNSIDVKLTQERSGAVYVDNDLIIGNK